MQPRLAQGQNDIEQRAQNDLSGVVILKEQSD
jgi:hypothetical protein